MLIALVSNYLLIGLKRGARGVINSPLLINAPSAGPLSVYGGRGGFLTCLINNHENMISLINERRAYV